MSILKRLVENDEFFTRYSYNREFEPDYRDSDYPTHIIVDGGDYEGLKVEAFHQRHRSVCITFIYDEKGKPLIPYSDLVIRRGWRLRVGV